MSDTLSQGLNNLQSTFQGFGKVTTENVFKVCDEPHPLLIKDMLDYCIAKDFDKAYVIISKLWNLGYAAEDIIGIIFRIAKIHKMPEYLKLEFIKVCFTCWCRCLTSLIKTVEIHFVR